MSRLEDIPKRELFRVPEDYFDKLPAKIQARIHTSKPERDFQPAARLALKYCLPLLVVAVLILYHTRSQPDVEAMLSSVETADLIQYIQESEITTHEMIENLEFSPDELEGLENDVFVLYSQDANGEMIDSALNSF